MSNHRNHREPRRNGPEDSFSDQAEPSYFQREASRTQAPSGSMPVDVEVLWFNAEKGFGFVKLADGADAFLHVSALESAGIGPVSEGTRMSVRLGQGHKGPQVAEVVSLRANAGVPAADRPRAVDVAGSRAPVQGTSGGTVKFYNAQKGFGFIALDGGSKEAFVHASVLKQCGLDILTEGQQVLVECRQGLKGPEVRSLKLA